MVLCAIGVIAAGGGHGSYFFVILASAPVWALAFAGPLGVGISFVAIPVLWISVGLLLNFHSRQKEAFFLAFMFVHYGSAIVLLLASREEWWIPNSILETFGLIWYCLGQGAIWMTFLRNIRSTTFSETGRQTTIHEKHA